MRFGAMGARGGFGGMGTALGSVSSYLGQIATRAAVPVFVNTGNKQMMSRSRHLSQESVSSVQILVPNFYVTTSGIETPSGGASTVTASVEYPAGTFTQVKFAGLANGTVPNGGSLLSDATSVFIPKGSWFFVRMYITNAAGIYFSSILDFNNGEGFAYGASGVADQTLGGTVINQDSINCVYPLAIIGRTSRPSIAIVGDSRGYGLHDTNSDASGDLGEIARSIGPSNAYINLSVPGDTAQAYISNSVQRRIAAAYCSHNVVQLGVNDFTIGRTAAQLIGDTATIYGLLGKKNYAVTIPPVTTSTDAWATTANQTLDVNNAKRVSFNNSVRVGLSGVVGYFEIADQVESARDSGKWIVNGAANYATNDGLHESNAADLLIKNSGAINPAVFRR